MKTKITVAQHFLRLPKSYRNLAMKNCTNHFKTTKDRIDALENGFDWDESPEGWDFWNKKWNDLIDYELRNKNK